MNSTRLPPNWAFVLDTATALAAGGRVLDYGCGQGEVVAAGLERGLDVYGAEVFYGGGHGQREQAARRGLLEKRVFEINQGKMPFDDGFFDFVFHNQVLEHVADLDAVLQEIRRVLKPGGMMLSLFPSRDVLREGHCGVPLAHRFRRGSELRYLWLLLGRRCGMGTFHEDKSPEQWARDFARWLEDWCYYRPEAEIREAYRRVGFSFEPRETEYAVFRLRYTGRERVIPFVQALSPFTCWLIRKLAGLVIVSRKELGL